MKVSEAIDVIRNAIKTDENYRNTWVANLACAFKDEFTQEYGRIDNLHEISNGAAERFLGLLLAGQEGQKDE